MLENIRTDKNISKVQLCEGVCTVTALTRYEQDMRVPDKFVIDCLLERLGKNSNKIEFIDTDEEFRISMYRNQIETLFFNREFLKVKEILDVYEKQINRSRHLHQQYICLKKGQLATIDGEYEYALELFQRALSYTERLVIVEFGVEKRLLSNIEIEILYSLAEIYTKINEKNKSFFVVSELKGYLKDLEKNNVERIKYLPKILLRLAEKEKDNFNFGLASSYLKEAEDILVKEYQISDLQKVLALQSEVAKQLGIFDAETDNSDKILALKLIDMKDGMITKEGVELWENTANLQL